MTESTQRKPNAFHLSLFVPSIEQTVRFYETVFGISPVKTKADYCKFEMEDPAVVLSFIEAPERVAPSYGHAGIRLDSIEALKENMARIKDAGIEITEEMGTDCCYARQDKFWIKDPAGFMWEFYYFHSDSEWTDPRTKKATCCSPVWVQQEEFLASKS